MKKILITGKDSYIGNHIQAWLEQFENQYLVEQLDVQDESWRDYCFSGVDAIVHVAGIVHRPDIKDEDLYNRVNAELPAEIAKKAKDSGVKQFVFLSTMAVFGAGKRLAENIINDSTPINPLSLYGSSKYLGECNLNKLEDENFKITIVRPPNVYGKDCKGGYITGFKSVVSKLPAIPSAYLNVKQSVLYIDNLSEFIRLCIDNEADGVFMPQDGAAVSSVELMSGISNAIGNKKSTSKILGLGIYVLSFVPLVKKAYGGVAYDEKMSSYFDNKYVVIPFEEGIKKTLN